MKKKEVRGSGPLSAKLWIVGEAPGENEEAKNEPFVGAAGKLLKGTISRNGGDVESIRYENLSGVRPPKNNFSWFESSPERKEELEKSIAALKDRIIECKPALVLCVGAQPLKYLMDCEGIGKWRGHIIYSTELDCKIMGTYHPSYCIQQRYFDKKRHPGQAEALFSTDIAKALEEKETRDVTHAETKTLVKPSFTDVISYCDHLLNNAKIISYDIETNRDALVDCIGFAGDNTIGMCIPLWVLGGKDAPIRYWDNEEEFIQILRKIKEVLESEIPKVAQNSQFDTVILAAYYNIYVRNLTWDTMVAAHDLYCDLPKDLGTLISLYTSLPYHKYLLGSGSIMDRWEYNAMDAIANLHVMEGQVKECHELGVYHHYCNIPGAAIKPLVEMQLIGVKVDEEIKQAALKQEVAIMDETQAALDKVFTVPFNTKKKTQGEHHFNPGSVSDKNFLFYDCFCCKKSFTKGRISTDKHALAKFKASSKRYVTVLAEACDRYRKAQSMASKLKTPLKDGRLHTAYGIGGRDEEGDEIGTDTGRLDSKKSVLTVQGENGKFVRIGTNLQNLKKGPQREMIIPEEDEEFLIPDLWAAEAFVTALDAQEPDMISMLNRGEKLHQWILDWTWENFGEECKKYDYTYHKAKQSIHSMNYDVKAKTMSKESGLPLYVTEQQYSYYHGKFPGIKMRMIRIKDQIRAKRVLFSLLGRRRLFVAPWGDELLKAAYAWPSQSVIGELTIIALIKLYWNGVYSTNVGTGGFKKQPPWTFPALNTHDGLVIRIKKGTYDLAKQTVKDAFNVPLTKDGVTIKIPVEVARGSNFNEARDTEVLWYE